MWQEADLFLTRAKATVLNDKVFVISEADPSVIFNYSRYCGKWRKYVTSGTVCPNLQDFMGVTIGKEFFVFGTDKECLCNYLLKLTYDDNGCFVWRDLTVRTRSQSPAPREFNAIWEDGRDVWIFGGLTRGRPDGFLSTHEEYFGGNDAAKLCNGLFQYDVRAGVWRNHENKGVVPPPSEEYIATRLGNMVWMYDSATQALYQLHLPSMNWTQVTLQTGLALVERRTNIDCFLLPIDHQKIVLCGGFVSVSEAIQDICILDTSRNSWSRHASTVDCNMSAVVRYPGTKTLFVIGEARRNAEKNTEYREIHLEPL
jgi:hypothetical protein